MIIGAGTLFTVQQAQPDSRAAPSDALRRAEDEQDPSTQNAIQELQEAAAGESESSPFGSELTEEEEKVVRELQKTDREVRAHEQAHKSAAGPYAGPIQYDTVTGPDGREYAVGGEVSIDTSPIPGNPQATIQKMDTVIRAALAPAQPSPQDFAVARAAQQARAQAQKELSEQKQAELEDASDGANGGKNLNTVDASEVNSDDSSVFQALSQALENTEELNAPRRGDSVNVSS